MLADRSWTPALVASTKLEKGMRAVKRYFKGVYGDSASITTSRDGRAKLVVKTCHGKTVANKVYSTERGARIAMGRLSDGWREAK